MMLIDDPTKGRPRRRSWPS